MSPFQRLIGPLFADGINAPRISHSGRDLPLSRVVSRTMHPDEGFHDHAGTVMVIAWGQFMDHDYTLTGTPLDPHNRNDPEECCKRPPHLKHPYCNEIRIPDDDYFYRLFGVKCIDFVRGFPSPRPGCRLGSRVPFNTLTGTIDGNTVYGVTEKFSRKLRTGYGGLLRMNPVFKEYGLKDLLPLKLDIPDEGCTRPNKNMYCFEAGEIRVNEQLVLTVMHTLMAREHNRVAVALAEVNPHWDDETLFQEARRINIAEIQHITYNEFLPILLGKDVMEKFGLVLQKDGYWDGYDSEVNPDVLDAFAAAAYRFGHSLLPTAVERWSKAHKFIASKRLSDLIRRPYDLYRAGVLDEYVMGLMNQVAQAMDDSITQEVTNHLFKKVGARFGMDLVSFNMQRGREFGLPGYMEFRKFCGLSGAETFQDLFDTMTNGTIRRYESIFEHPVDVDLWSGGVSERPLPGSMLGPTFACIIATQFSYSRRGDRFWFELPNQPSSFTPEQLTEIRKSRLARVICDNTDIIDTVQLYPMVLPDHELNPRVPCRSGVIPSMDFSKWAEPAPLFGAAKQYMTQANVTNEFAGNDTKDALAETHEKKLDCNTNKAADNPKTKSMNEQANNTESTNQSKLELVFNITATKSNVNKIQSDDTLMKYIYKGDENKTVADKETGYPRNSLKRRKRSEYNPHNQNIQNPANFKYSTVHDVGIQGELKDQGIRADIIQSAELADFNIETLHSNTPTAETYSQVAGSLETDSAPNFRKQHDENNSFQNSNEDTSRNEESSREEPNNKLTSNESQVNNSDESYEKSDGNSKEEQNDNSESKEYSDKDEEKLYPSEQLNDKYKQRSSDESSENYESSETDRHLNNNDIFDLKGNSSQENSSENQSLKTASEEDNSSSSIESSESPRNSPYSEKQVNATSEKFTSDIDLNSFLVGSIENSEEKSETLINDGEVKPVIELNDEDNSDELSKEIRDGSHSLSLQNNGKDGHGITLNKNEDDVKQQFERIPLNYKHKDEQLEKDQRDDAPLHNSDTLESKSDEADGKQNSTDSDNERYDKNLNFKFDVIPIKLPEIKLPDDILDYAYEPIYKDKNEDEYSKTHKPIKSDDKWPYYTYKPESDNYGLDLDVYNKKRKSKYSDKITDSKNDDNSDEEDEDLYEKFVRERFGKRGSFAKRSEKLRVSPAVDNRELYNTIQNVLKRAEDIQKEADKSADPNANYLWTLEYGEKL
ncbi:peroxidasin homolog [Aricia agestis]|uniref:peroxidasin homolog n=1 Tax=Aricia agestis TaxID=91739 RepID=UPI001C205CD1|nr:peroxidasin homolog [Aricia agestis]